MQVTDRWKAQLVGIRFGKADANTHFDCPGWGQVSCTQAGDRCISISIVENRTKKWSLTEEVDYEPKWREVSILYNKDEQVQVTYYKPRVKHTSRNSPVTGRK